MRCYRRLAERRQRLRRAGSTLPLIHSCAGGTAFQSVSRRRRENTPAGSKKRRDLWVTVEEEAALVARAEREKVTVPNLLISSALTDYSDSPTERRAIAAELMSLHNLLARSSNNINQIARQANATSEFPVEAREALKHIRSVAMRIDDAIDGLM
jgi:hypothetical protein